jgi:hypothetical protein
MFDIFCIGNNSITKILPSVKQISDLSEIKSLTKMYWVIEPNIGVTDLDVFKFRPEEYDSGFTHVWKWNKDNYGGIKLIPKKTSQGIKEHDNVVCEKSFDVLTTDTPTEYFESHPFATHVWVADPDYILPQKINWAPDNFEPGYTHIFHIQGQLEHKYPNKEGGIKLYPRDNPLKADIKYHGYLDVTIQFPVIRSQNLDNYCTRSDSKYVWLVDPELAIHDSELSWIPNDFQRNMVHNFHVQGQLLHKYPEEQGPVSLVPMGVDKPDIVYHGDIDITYPVLRVTDPNDYTQLSKHSNYKFVWLVDSELDIDDSELKYNPNIYQRDMVHNFQVEGQLEFKYPEAQGPVSLVPMGVDKPDIVYSGFIDVQYPVLRVSDPNDYTQVSKYQNYKFVWLVDSELDIDDSELDYIPSIYQRNMIHNFQVIGQLEFKYPEEQGPVSLVPVGVDKPDIVYHGDIDVKYPILRVTDPNNYTQVSNYKDEHQNYKFVWLVDSELELSDSELNYIPSIYQRNMVHNFQVAGQLEFKYPEEQGPVSLVPVGVDKPDIVYHGAIDVDYQIIMVSDPSDFTQRDHITDEFVWLIDQRYSVQKDLLFTPEIYDRSRIHNFQLSHQLEHLYPEDMGGVYLVPRDWKDAELKIMGKIDGLEYPVLYSDTPSNFSLRDNYDTDYVWIIDKNYKINTKTLTWAPNVFENDQIHNFKMPNQLREKYPQSMGGIFLVPQKYKDAELNVHKTCPIEDEIYEVFKVDHTELTTQKFTELSNLATTEWFWVIDSDYDFNGKLRYVPADHEEEYIHIFKWGLEHRYIPEITEVWDNRVAGIYLLNKYFDSDKKKLHTNIVPVEYDVFYTDDVSNIHNITKYARQSRTDAFWLVDIEHRLPDRINWVPDVSDQKYINIFKLSGQLDHKYPKDKINPSDNRAGGVKLIPKNYNFGDVKFCGDLHQVEFQEFEKFETYEQGIIESSSQWFWVIDSDVDVAEDFDWDFIPDPWDTGKTHVWQILNPVTGLSYDYDGIKLYHKQPQSGRDKYIKTVGSTRKNLDILYLDSSTNIIDQLNNYESSTYMFYVVDPNVTLNPNFKFDIYPTQWDKDCVHLFKNSDGTFKNIRLVPANYKFESLDQLTNNSYDKLKEHDIVATINREWPVHYLKSLDSSEFHALRKTVTEPWFFTVDPDCSITDELWDYVPAVKDFDRVHTWQRLNPHTKQVHGYGGVRLWPTEHSSHITTDALIYNKIPKLRYVRNFKSSYNPYPVVLLSYHEERAQTAFDALSELSIHGDLLWVKDVKGIFEAHKEAAKLAGSSKMFWVVDADAELKPSFDFTYIPDIYDQETVHVWTTENPVTGSAYGYGGVKLFNTNQVIDSSSWGLDFTTGLSSKFKLMPEVCAVTKFNTTAYDTWRSAFREVVKLSVSTDPDAKYRIEEWLHPISDSDYSHDAKRGAQEAVAFAKQNNNNQTELDRINDYDWLKKKCQEQK